MTRGLRRDLLQQPCQVTGKLLAADLTTSALVLPYIRPFKLSRQQLLALASGAEASTALHAHALAAS